MSNHHIVLFAVFAFLFLFFGCLGSETENGKNYIEIINASGTNSTITTIFVEIADEPDEISKGLMFRELLAPDHGMLFLLNRDDFHPFWMKNTKIPLETIYIAANGTIVDIIEMEPCKADPCRIYTPKSKSRYVLEVNANLSKMKGFRILDYVDISRAVNLNKS
ncbi:MAG: DUF192 domain-containing protein [Candidatus Micrarchaeota archaeon]